MNIPSEQAMKAELLERLTRMIELGFAFNNAQEELGTMGATDPSRYYTWHFASGVRGTITYFFNEICQKITTENANGTPAKVVWPEYLNQFVSEELPTMIRDRESRERQEASVRQIIATMPFDAISESLGAQAIRLESDGFRLLANRLASDLNITRHYDRPRFRAARVHCELQSCRAYQQNDKVRELVMIGRALQAIQAQSDVVFGLSLSELVAALNALRYEEAIPSRTVFGAGRALEIHCFKNKYELRFTRKAFDVICAFIMLCGSNNSIEAVSALLQEAEAA